MKRFIALAVAAIMLPGCGQVPLVAAQDRYDQPIVANSNRSFTTTYTMGKAWAVLSRNNIVRALEMMNRQSPNDRVTYTVKIVPVDEHRRSIKMTTSKPSLDLEGAKRIAAKVDVLIGLSSTALENGEHSGQRYVKTYSCGSHLASLWRAELNYFFMKRAEVKPFNFTVGSKPTGDLEVKLSGLSQDEAGTHLKELNHRIQASSKLGNVLSHQGPAYKRSYTMGANVLPLYYNQLEWFMTEKAGLGDSMYTLEANKGDIVLTLSGMSEDQAKQVFANISRDFIAETAILSNAASR